MPRLYGGDIYFTFTTQVQRKLEVKIQGNFDAVSVSLTGFEWANRLVFTNESDV